MALFQNGADWLIAGLGNPEPKYDGTRHNAGFAALDFLAQAWACPLAKAKWQGLYGVAEVGGHKAVLLKPLTYMNLSGQSIAPAAMFYKIPANHIIVLCDDVAQPTAHLRIRPSGSAGGHNGLKSIMASLGTDTFYRVRIGVGEKPDPRYDLADWVLGKFPAADAKAIAGRYPDIAAACRLLMDGDLQMAQSRYNH
ncbi:MAG: aminoacyl-tRNA hydrolase [Gemmiger sp.]|nr:aminoacyl-tRNA hydrolase [Gemmiger sp.]